MSRQNPSFRSRSLTLNLFLTDSVYRSFDRIQHHSTTRHLFTFGRRFSFCQSSPTVLRLDRLERRLPLHYPSLPRRRARGVGPIPPHHLDTLFTASEPYHHLSKQQVRYVHKTSETKPLVVRPTALPAPLPASRPNRYTSNRCGSTYCIPSFRLPNLVWRMAPPTA